MSDTLAALQNPNVLKSGLNPLALASQSYRLDDPAASQQRLLNLYAEKMPPGSRSAFILKSTPGCELFLSLGNGPILEAVSFGSMMWLISGSRAYALPDGPNPAPLDLGDVGVVPSEAFGVSIAVGTNAVVFCVPPRAYVTDLAGAILVQITTGSGNFPAAGCSSVTYMDGYWAFTSFDGLTVFVSELLDARNYDSLAFAQVSSFAEYVKYCTALNGDLWLFGQTSLQPWYDTGDPTFPFSPRQGAVIKVGLGSPKTVVQLDGSIFWLGIDKSVYRTNGYQPKRISDHGVEAALSDYNDSDLLGISACGFVHEGHEFYSLQLPLFGAGTTFVYDVANELWHERCSSIDGTGIWRINKATPLNGRLLAGDALDGSIYRVKSSLFLENGNLVPRIAVLPTIDTHGREATMNRLEIRMAVGNQGPPGSIAVDWSDDGGVTWIPKPRMLSTGQPNKSKTRVATARMGGFRQRVLRLSAFGHVTIYGADADVSVGT